MRSVSSELSSRNALSTPFSEQFVLSIPFGLLDVTDSLPAEGLLLLPGKAAPYRTFSIKRPCPGPRQGSKIPARG
jgi:hypothetical protein